MRVVSVEEMREIERRAETEYGLTSPMLMERAGQSVAEILRSHAGGDVRDLDVLVLVGPGNNGGDGRVMGRYLAGWGARVTLLSLERALRSNATARWFPLAIRLRTCARRLPARISSWMPCSAQDTRVLSRRRCARRSHLSRRNASDAPAG